MLEKPQLAGSFWDFSSEMKQGKPQNWPKEVKKNNSYLLKGPLRPFNNFAVLYWLAKGLTFGSLEKKPF